MINKFVNERVLMILTSVGLFYYLYTKYLKLEDRQNYLERNVVRVVEHLNKLTIDQVVREVNDNDVDNDVNSTTVEVGNDSDNDNYNQVRVQSDAEFSYIQSDEPLDTEEEDFDDPHEMPEDETIIIGNNKNAEHVKGSHCSVVLHSGKRKGFVCGKPAIDGFCGVHKNKAPKPQDDTPLDRMGESNVVDM